MDAATLERAGAIARLVCTLVAGIATMLGFYLDADELFTGVCCIVALACLVATWWKNNNITDAAIEAQEVLDSLKSGDLEDLAGVECTDGECDEDNTLDCEADGTDDSEDVAEDDPEGGDYSESEYPAEEPEDATVSEAGTGETTESTVSETIDGETVETVVETYPDASWTKKEIAAWLEARGVEVRTSWNKSELLAKVEEVLQS